MVKASDLVPEVWAGSISVELFLVLFFFLIAWSKLDIKVFNKLRKSEELT